MDQNHNCVENLLKQRSELDYEIFVREIENNELKNASKFTPGGPENADESSDIDEDDDISR